MALSTYTKTRPKPEAEPQAEAKPETPAKPERPLHIRGKVKGADLRAAINAARAKRNES